MKTDRILEARRSLPKTSSIHRLSTNIRENPYPRSPLHSGSTSTRYRLSDYQWTEREKSRENKRRLMQFLDTQLVEKAQIQRKVIEAERRGDMESLARWRAEVAAEKQKELEDREKKRQARVLLEREYAREYKERVRVAAKEREEDEAHVRALIRQAHDDVQQQRFIKQGFRRMFQDLIRVNEHQKHLAVIQHEAELRRDAVLQRELQQKLAAQDEAREKAIKDRVLRQQIFLNGEAAKEDGGKVSDQEMYRKVLDKQVKEHRMRDLAMWMSG